jgi:hypothetical protein
VEARDAAVALAGGRIAIGLTALAAPKVASRMMFGAAGRACGCAGVRTDARGPRRRPRTRGYDRPGSRGTEAGALADGVDLASALLAHREIRRAAFVNTVLLAGAAAWAGIALSRRLDPPPPADPGHPEAIATGHSSNPSSAVPG